MNWFLLNFQIVLKDLNLWQNNNTETHLATFSDRSLKGVCLQILREF